MGRPFLQSDNPLNCFRVEYVTADTVTGIGGVTDHRSLINLLHYAADQSELGIMGINLNYHGRLSMCDCPLEIIE